MSGGEGAAAARARRRLAVGALAGVALAAAALLRGGAGVAPPADLSDAVAWVDGEPISREAFARLVAQAAGPGGALELDEARRRELLDALIDEELLLREGLALGLARREPNARRAIVSAVVEGIASEGAAEPDEAALEALYAETREQWRQPGPVRVAAALVPVAPGSTPAVDQAARERALALVARARAGEPLASLAAAEGAAPPTPLPAAPLPLAALRGRLPVPAFGALAALAPGAISEPVRSAEGWWVLELVEREPDQEPPLDAILPDLRNLWQQRQHEEAIRAHVGELRKRTTIRYADPPAAG